MAKQLKKRESFEIHQPQATNVQLAGDFTEWDKSPIAMKKNKSGKWKAVVWLQPGAHQYRFLVDGRWHDDPDSESRVPNPFGAQNCIRRVQ